MRIFTLMMLTLALLHANEVERIESIVNEVTELRKNYELCKTEVDLLKERECSTQTSGNQASKSVQKTCEQAMDKIKAERDAQMQESLEQGNQIKQLQKEMKSKDEKIAALQSEVESLKQYKTQQSKRSSTAVSEKEHQESIAKLNAHMVSESKRYELQINQLQNELLISEKKVALLHEALEKKNKPTPCVDPNPFPKLMMKERYQQSENDHNMTVIPKQPVKVEETVIEPVPEQKNLASTFFKPRPFRLSQDADIYDRPGGKVIDRWEARTSFTSGEKQKGWIRITGYFVNKKWRPSKEKSLWVEEKNTIMR